jgi:peptidoglycan/xylan/chitin deacetylase (PgdA/CDA1 family)
MTAKTTSFLFLITAFFGCAVSETQTGQTEIMQWQDGKKAAISVTYDDATINQFRKALPIMDSLGFSGTFYINTADIPGSQFPPKFIGRPLRDIIIETEKSVTNKDNLFERASALRFLDITNAIPAHNSAGSLYETGKLAEAFKVVDDAFAEVRKKGSYREIRPVLLEGDVITWNEIKEFAKRGHEFGNHTISHPRLAVLDEQNLLYELEKCKEEILNQLGSDHIFSAECPFGTENERVMEYAYKIHPALRNRMPEPFLEELNRWNQNTPASSRKEYVQWQRGPLQKTTMEQMKSWVDTLVSHDNVWLVLTFHGVDGVGWEAKPHQELREYFSYMKKHEEHLWVATFRDVTKYIRERMNARLKVNEKDNSWEIDLTHSLDKNLYNFPLTLKTYVDPEWVYVRVAQAGTILQYHRDADDKGPYILYRVMPNKGKILLSQETLDSNNQ